MRHRTDVLIASLMLAVMIAAPTMAAPPAAPRILGPSEIPPTTDGGSFPATPGEVGITDAACPNWDSLKKTVSGGLDITNDGAVIEYHDISGGEIDVNASNVTVRCTRIRTTARYPINCSTFGGNQCGGRLLIENVEAIGDGANGSTSAVAIIFASDSTIRNSYLTGGVDTLKIHGARNTIEGSYIGCQSGRPGDHMDTIQTRKATDLTLRNNYMVGLGCSDSGNNASTHNSANIFMQNNDGPITRLLIEGNYIHGGGKLIHFDEDADKAPASIEQITVRNNRGTANFWRFNSVLPAFDVTSNGRCSVWTGNTFSDGTEWKWTGATGGGCDLPQDSR